MSTYVSNRDSGGKTNEEGHYRFQTNVWAGNVLSGMLVEQNSSPNMTVRVSAGDIKIDYQNYAYTGWSDSYTSVTITTADTSNPRIDRIVAYIDRSLTFTSSDTNNPGALKFKAVNGTASSTPLVGIANDAAVQSSVGASNPWCELGRVYVGANVTQVTTSNISDTRTFVKSKVAAGDWTPLNATISSVTYNTQRSYDINTSTDLTSSLSTGMRLRVARTTPSPVQCTNLNGTNQYYSKSSPVGMTFTDDFVVMGWVKLSSYASSAIISRRDGTQGWQLSLNGSGQLSLIGYNNGLANYSSVTTNQSLPVGKWVRFVAQLDMSAFTTTSTTSYILIDGVDVPVTPLRNGTNPTSLVQAGNLEIGSVQGGAFLPGKVAQVAVFNAKVTQATARNYESQGFTGTETSLISAYSFNNSITDLNTTNANNLTANGSAVATNADSPFGGQANGSISSTLDYAIVHKVTSSVVTVQVPEGCTIPTIGSISALSYSTASKPYGFPAAKSKWRISSITIAYETASIGGVAQFFAASGGKLTVPIGEWTIGYSGNIAFNSSVGSTRSGWWVIATGGTPPWSAISWVAGLTTRVLSFGGASAAHTPGQTYQPISQTAMSVWSTYGGVDSASGVEVFLVGYQQIYEVRVDNDLL